MDLIERIYSVSHENFEDLALELYQYQMSHNPVYAAFCDQLKTAPPKELTEIPFLPISFFKSHQIIVEGKNPEIIFKSSGTGGDRSQHFVASAEMYRRSFLKNFIQEFGSIEDLTILALLPNYIQQGDSSLVYMVQTLITESKNEVSGFVLNDHEELLKRIKISSAQNKRTIIIGVSYALLDLAEAKPDLSGTVIIETGGMKGRRKEMTKAELHEALKQAFGTASIHSEYGMTELLSQAYSHSNGIFHSPEWMRILIRDTNDPLTLLPDGKTGGVNVIDLANIYSCPFIATQDLGRITPEGFEILGRFDLADIRGCNLLVQ